MRQIAKYYVLSPKTQPFSPLDLSPALWLDASDTATITASLGSVSQWDDKSGNGRHVTQGTAAAQPKTGTATLNGLNVIQYDSATDNQTLANLSFNLYGIDYTWFWVVEVNASDLYIVFNSYSGAAYAFASMSGSGSSIITSANVTRGSLHVNGVAQTVTTRGQIYSAIGTSPAIVRMQSTLNSNSAGIFVTYTNGANFSGGTKLAELVIVQTPTAQQTTDVETYLATKWGL